jgi:hypothetical protein
MASLFLIRSSTYVCGCYARGCSPTDGLKYSRKKRLIAFEKSLACPKSRWFMPTKETVKTRVCRDSKTTQLNHPCALPRIICETKRLGHWEYYYMAERETKTIELFGLLITSFHRKVLLVLCAALKWSAP